MAQSVSDKAKKDAKNGIYDPPVGGTYEEHLYERVWEEVTLAQKGLSK